MFARVDPRVKILQLALVGFCTFSTRSIAAQGLLAIAIAGLAYAADEKGRALALLIFTALLSVLLGLPVASGTGMMAFYLKFVVFFVLKFTPAVVFVVLLSHIEDVTRFIHALERLRVPRVLTLPFAVAMRFVPSLSYELSCIKDAMRLRGIQPTVIGFYRHPVATLEYLSVPLLMRSLKIADELSASAITRGIDAAGARTRYAALQFRAADAGWALGSIAAAILLIVIDRWLV